MEQRTILLLIVAILLVMFFFPKQCGGWSSWGGTDTKCMCIGKTITPRSMDAGPHICFGICLKSTCETTTPGGGEN